MAESIGSATLDLRTDDSGFNRGIDGAHKRATKLEAQFERTGRKLESIGKRAGEVGKTMTTRLTVPIVAAFGGVAKAAGDIESGMIGVQKTTGLADDQIRTLRNDLLKFASSANVTTDNLLGTAQAAGQMGIKGSDAIADFTKAFAALEIASDRTIQGELGARTFAKFLDLTGEGTENAGSMASALVELGNTSKTTEGNILQLGIEIASRASAYGLAGANVAGFATALDEAGVQSQRAASTFQTFFQTLDTSIKSGNDNLQNFVNLTGLSVAEIRNLMETNPSKIMVEFAQGLHDFNDPARSSAELLNDMGLGALRVSGTLDVMASRVDRVRDRVEVANKAQRENTALQAEFAQANRGFNSAMQQLGNSLKALAVAIADAGLLDWLKNTAAQLREWAGDLANVNPKILKWGTVIAGVTAVLGPATAALGFMVLGIGKFVTALGTARLALLPLAGPAGLVVAIASALTLFLTKTKTGQVILEAFAGAFDIIVQAGRDVAAFLGPWIDTVIQWLDGFIDDSISAFQRFDEQVASILRGIGGLYDTWIVQPLENALKFAAGLILDFVDNLLAIGEVLPGIGDGAKQLRSDFNEWRESLDRTNKALDITISKSAEAFGEIETGTGAVADSVVELDKVVVSAEGTNDALDDLLRQDFFNRWADDMDEASESAENVNKVTEEAAEQFRRFGDAILSNIPIASIRLRTLDETIQSLEGNTSDAADAAVELSDDFKSALADTEEQIRNQRQVWDNLIDGVQGAWVGMFEDAFQGKGISSVKDFLSSVKDLFLKVIAQIAAAWVSSKIFGIGDGINLGSLGDLGGLLSGGSGGGSNIISAGASAIAKKLGIGAATTSGAGGSAAIGGISGTSVTGGASGAGLGGGSTAGLSMGPMASAAAGAAILLAQREIISAIQGPSSLDKAMKDLEKAGPSVAGGLGLAATAGDKFGFGAGDNAGFAAEFAKRQIGNRAGTAGEGLAVFKGFNMDETIRMLAQAEQKFLQLQRVGTESFRAVGVNARQMGKFLQDGVIDQADKAALGIEHIGAIIENPKTGMKELGDISLEQFDRITAAIQSGELRLDALTGKTKLNQEETRLLGQIGVGAHNQIVQAAGQAAGAARSLGTTSRNVFSEIQVSGTGAARSLGQSFNDAADQASAGMKRFESQTSGALNNIANSARNAAGQISGIASGADAAARAANRSFGSIKVPNLPGNSGGRIPGLADGGIVTRPTLAVIGEAGPEAVVPLSGRGGGMPSITINQTINGGDPEEVARATRRELQRFADGWPIS